MAGTNLGAAVQNVNPTLWIRETEPTPTGTNGVLLALSAVCTGAPPTTANLFHHGCTMIQLDTASGNPSLFENTGTVAVPVWTLVATSAPGTIGLTNTHVLVGNAANLATDVAMSGDATMANTGALTIANGAITDAKVNAAAAIAYSKLAALPSTDILVGSAANVATAVAMTGDVTISNTGVTTYTLPKVFTAQVTLTNAQVLTLNTTPIQIVAAPGSANLVVLPFKSTMAYTRGAASYATNTELDLIHSGSANALEKTSIAGAASTFAPFVSAVSATPSGNVFIANAALNVFVPTGNPTGGDAGSSIKVTVDYVIMSVL
jgi:hypothetical protein